MKTYRFTWFLKRGGFHATEVEAKDPKSAIEKGKRIILERIKDDNTTSRASFSSSYCVE